MGFRLPRGRGWRLMRLRPPRLWFRFSNSLAVCGNDVVRNGVINVVGHRASLHLERERIAAIRFQLQFVRTVAPELLDFRVTPRTRLAGVSQVLPLDAIRANDQAAVVV